MTERAEPGFADGSWFDPEPGATGMLGMTLEQLAGAIRIRLAIDDALPVPYEALDEILRRIDASVGDA